MVLVTSKYKTPEQQQSIKVSEEDIDAGKLDSISKQLITSFLALECSAAITSYETRDGNNYKTRDVFENVKYLEIDETVKQVGNGLLKFVNERLSINVALSFFFINNIQFCFEYLFLIYYCPSCRKDL